MAATTKKVNPYLQTEEGYALDGDRDGYGFDVTCVIGRVDVVPQGDVPAHVAAFELIARHDAQGSFRFPMPDGRTCVVDVFWEDPKEAGR